MEIIQQSEDALLKQLSKRKVLISWLRLYTNYQGQTNFNWFTHMLHYLNIMSANNFYKRHWRTSWNHYRFLKQVMLYSWLDKYILIKTDLKKQKNISNLHLKYNGLSRQMIIKSQVDFNAWHFSKNFIFHMEFQWKKSYSNCHKWKFRKHKRKIQLLKKAINTSWH